MKKFIMILTIAFSFLWQGASSQNLIAVQNGGNLSFFTNIETALQNAANGDTIYLPGGYIQASGTILIDKSIHLVGVGYRPDSNSVTGNTIIPHDIKFIEGIDDASIEGLFLGSQSILICDSVENILIKRCLIYSITIGNGLFSAPATGIEIIESIINNGVTGYCDNGKFPKDIYIGNCQIGNLCQGSNWYFSFSPVSALNYSCYSPQNIWGGLVIKNSIIWGGSRTGYYSCNIPFFSGIRNSVFTNCVFFDVDCGYGGYVSESVNNTFNNCIFNQPSEYIPSTPNNIIFNCFFNQSKENTFINAQSNTFELLDNYQLTSTSPGKNAGRDGTDIGIYGGSFPWKDGSIPFNPHFQAAQIAPTTDSTGNLNVNIKVSAQDR